MMGVPSLHLSVFLQATGLYTSNLRSHCQIYAEAYYHLLEYQSTQQDKVCYAILQCRIPSHAKMNYHLLRNTIL